MKDLLYWVWLSRIFYYGSNKFWLMLREFSTPKAIYQADESALQACPFLKKEECQVIKRSSLERAEMILDACEKHQIKVMSYHDPSYPQRLKNLYSAPPVIYMKGEMGAIDDEVVIAVVGTRRASDYGTRLTGNLCYEIAKAGAVIVSGCADGIDTYAHYGALKANAKTIAVLGCGLDVNYPSKNKKLKEAIIQKGALMTECPPGEHVTRTIFPVRNRLIAALSVGVVLTEAPIKSGALITAEHAIEQGKDLFCVPPHDIYDANFAGVSDYLRDGAKVVYSPKDVLEEYWALYPDQLHPEVGFVDFTKRHRPKSLKKSLKKQYESTTDQGQLDDKPMVVNCQEKKWDDLLSSLHKMVYDAMSESPLHLDEIAARAQVDIAQAGAVVVELELLEYITSYSGKRYAKTTLLASSLKHERP